VQYPSVSLIIPCYNESIRVAKMIDGIKEFIATWHGLFEIIIIDDGSTDDTVSLIKNNLLYKNLLADNKIQLIQQTNTGKGGALQIGITAATLDFVLTVDADMAAHPVEIMNWRLQNKATFARDTICIASRTLAASKLILISNRRSSGKLFNTIVRIITNLPFKDTQCGFKLYPRAIAQQLFANLRTKGWAHDVEILLQANKQSIPVIEMPITWNERDASKINVLRDGMKMLWEVMKMRFYF
jgi:dolichyl-phosphate beta-glucosyltransferase